MIKRVREWLFWTDPFEIICIIVGIILGLLILGFTVLLILGLCGVIPLEPDASNFNVAEWSSNPANPASPVHRVLFHHLH